MPIVKKWAAISGVLLCVAQVACTPISDDASYDPVAVAAQIRESSQTWASVSVTGDASVMETIFADDFIGTDSEGKIYTKRQFIDFVTENPGGRFVSNTVNDVDVRFFGNVAVAQGHETFTREDGVSNRFVWTDIYALRDGRWQMVAAQDVIAPVEIEAAGDGLFNSSRGAE